MKAGGAGGDHRLPDPIPAVRRDQLKPARAKSGIGHDHRAASGRHPLRHAAYKLSEKDGLAKLGQQAKWLAIEYPDAAASLLKGLEETNLHSESTATHVGVDALCVEPPHHREPERCGA